MGAPIGYFANQQPQDYPDLNKCPDCETFFPSDTCPLCGKVCPEEFRAGNRKTVKPKKQRGGRSSGRVEFVPWYYSGWFIVAMLLFFPIVGLVLLWSSRASKGWKIGGTLLPVAVAVLPTLLGLLLSWMLSSNGAISFPDLPREEYIASCETIDPEDYYRTPNDMIGRQVQMEVTVVRRLTAETGEIGSVTTFYECEVRDGDRIYQFLVGDARQEGAAQLAAGDRITLWGETYGGGSIYVSSIDDCIETATILMFYADILN